MNKNDDFWERPEILRAVLSGFRQHMKKEEFQKTVLTELLMPIKSSLLKVAETLRKVFKFKLEVQALNSDLIRGRIGAIIPR